MHPPVWLGAYLQWGYRLAGLAQQGIRHSQKKEAADHSYYPRYQALLEKLK